jgi:hypothetical protein
VNRDNGSNMDVEAEYLWNHPTTNRDGLIRIASELISALRKTPEPAGSRSAAGRLEEIDMLIARAPVNANRAYLDALYERRARLQSRAA